MKLSTKIEWLFKHSGISTYHIADKTGITRQTLDVYKKDSKRIAGMGLERAEKLEDYINQLTKEDILDPEKMKTQQILIKHATRENIETFFKDNPYAAKLNWIKPHKDMFIVNFDVVSNKNFKKWPYDLDNLYFIADENRKMKKKFIQFVRVAGERIELGGSRCLYKLENGKTYQILTSISTPDNPRPISYLGIIETDVYRDDLVYKLPESLSFYDFS